MMICMTPGARRNVRSQRRRVVPLGNSFASLERFLRFLLACAEALRVVGRRAIKFLQQSTLPQSVELLAAAHAAAHAAVGILERTRSRLNSVVEGSDYRKRTPLMPAKNQFRRPPLANAGGPRLHGTIARDIDTRIVAHFLDAGGDKLIVFRECRSMSSK
jgi:hypothetical protein